MHYVLIFLAVPLVAWVVVNIPDAKLDPAAGEFFQTEPFNFDNSFHVAWAGIFAPADAQDLYAYGLKVVKGDIDPENARSLRYAEADVTYCLSQAEIRQKRDCASEAQLQAVQQKNRLLLSRYQELYRQKDRIVSIGDKFHVSGTFSQDIISLHRTLAAHWINQARQGQGAQALDEWLLSTKTIQTIVAGKINLVESVVWMVVYGINLRVLPVILDSDPGMVPLYKDRLIETLGKDYMDVWNLEDTMRAEYTAFAELEGEGAIQNFFYQPNHSANKFYAFTQDMMMLADLPPRELIEKSESVIASHDPCFPSYNIGCYGYNMVGNFVMGAMLKGGELLVKAHRKTAQHRALILWIQAKSQELPASRMEDFLLNADPSRYDPFTEKPFRWDKDAESIYFEIYFEPETTIRADLYY